MLTHITHTHHDARKMAKLESKLGLALGNTAVAKKNQALREKLNALKDEKQELRSMLKNSEEEVLRATAEIRVLERAVEIKQRELDGGVEGESENTAIGANGDTDCSVGGDTRLTKKSRGGSNHKGDKRPLREQLLYQLALKKEEAHSLALELAHKVRVLS